MHHTSASPIGSEPVDDSHRLALAAELAGHFIVERQVQRDPWSVVYVARDVAHGHPVAIRVLHEIVGTAQRAHVDRMVHVLARLHHSNIVDLHEVRWLRDGRLAVVRQWVDGECLRDVLHDEPLTLECVVEVLHDVARALRVAQSRARALGIPPDLVHRAVAPEHVLLDRETGSALLDPSLAVLGLADAEPDCLAPELLALRPPTARTDVYTLGVLGWEMLTGRSPCADSSPGGASNEGTEATLWRAMQAKVAWRWASVDEFLLALQPKSATPEGDVPMLAQAPPSGDQAGPEMSPSAFADPDHADVDWDEVERVEAARAEVERAAVEQDAVEQERHTRQELEQEEAARAKADSAQAVLARWSEEALGTPPGGGADASILRRDATGHAPGVAGWRSAPAHLLGRARAHPALATAVLVAVLSAVAVGGVLLGRSPAVTSTRPPRAAPRQTPGTDAARPATAAPSTGAPRTGNGITVASFGEPVLGAAALPNAPSARSSGAAPVSLGVARDVFARMRRAVGREESLVAVATTAAGSRAVDSLPPDDPRPRTLWGAWHHSDGTRMYARPSFSDVLTLHLNPDGSATLDERRYTLLRSGAWSVATVVHEGSWDVRDPMLTGSTLCIRWRTPSAATACEPISVSHDTTALGPLLTFAGRHWRAGTPPPELMDHPSAGSQAKARRHAKR